MHAALMNWKIRSDDGKQAVLDIGDWGGLIIRAAATLRRHRHLPPAPPPPPAGADPAAAGRQGRGGGRGPAAPVNCLFDNFCWGIEPWMRRRSRASSEARLESRRRE
jgi:hypothetical protein